MNNSNELNKFVQRDIGKNTWICFLMEDKVFQITIIVEINLITESVVNTHIYTQHSHEHIIEAVILCLISFIGSKS